MTDMQALRAEHEVSLLSLEGVVGVSTGEKAGAPALVIYCSQPVEKVAARLPEALSSLPLQLTFIGQVNAQEVDR